jgi:CRP-like cAMP-binding protein
MTDALSARFGRDFAAGTVLFREGETGDEMFVIQSGLVRITKQVGGEERPLATFGRGEFLGEMAILNGKPRTATATVLEEARCLVINGEQLAGMLAKNPEIAIRLVTKLARRLDSADELIQILLNPDPKARVMLGLKRHAESFGEPSEGGVRILIGPEELAREVGTAVADVRDVLARLRRLRIIAFDEATGSIVVGDVGRLHEFLEFLEMPRRFEAP